MRCILYFMAILMLVVPAANAEADERFITHEELLDKPSDSGLGKSLETTWAMPGKDFDCEQR